NGVDVLRIELWPDGAGDIGIRDRDAVNQPRDLMAAADVQLVVDHVGARYKLRHDVHAVAAKGTRGPFHLIARHEAFRGDGFQVDDALWAGHLHRLRDFAEQQIQLERSHRPRPDDDPLFDG